MNIKNLFDKIMGEEEYEGFEDEEMVEEDVVPAYQLQTDKTAEGYLPLESDVVLYGGDVSSKLALQNTYGNKYEIVIENYDDEDEFAEAKSALLPWFDMLREPKSFDLTDCTFNNPADGEECDLSDLWQEVNEMLTEICLD